MRLLSFNCCAGKFWNSGKFIDIVNQINPNVICLQECNNTIVDNLKKSLNYYAVQPSGKQGFSCNYTLIQNQHTLSNITTLEIKKLQRDVLFNTVSIDGKQYVIGNLHLKSGRENAKIRETQIDQLMGFIDRRFVKTDRVILVGDWNLAVDEIAWPIPGWKSNKLYPTYRCENKNAESKRNFHHPFDRVLYRGFKMTQMVALEGDVCSDHDMLLCSTVFVDVGQCKSLEPLIIVPKVVESKKEDKKNEDKKNEENKKPKEIKKDKKVTTIGKEKDKKIVTTRTTKTAKGIKVVKTVKTIKTTKN